MNNLKTNRKFKYGSTAVILTAVVIAVIILLNVVVTALTEHYLLYIEMDEEDAFYGLSDGTKTLIDALSTESRDELEIKIIFCMPLDEMIESTDTYRIYACAQSFANEYDFIKIEYLDTIAHPDIANKYKTTANTSINSQSIIIENGTSFRVYSMTAMYTTAYSTGDVFSFDGEYKIATCILQLMNDDPIVYFTVGHGEENEIDAASEVETDGSSNVSEDTNLLYKLFTDAGYEVRTIDLSTEEIDENAKVIVINNPKYDFLGADDSVNEIKKITNYMAGCGNLWVFVDPSARELPNLEELLGDWGIHFGNAAIKDTQNSLAASDGRELIAVYSEEETLGASLHSTIRSLESIPKTIVQDARPIYYDEKFSNAYGQVETTTVLYSSSTAVAYSFDDEEQTNGTIGTYNLMTFTRESRMVDNEAYNTNILVCGTSHFSDDKYLRGNSYGNADILFAAMQACGKTTVPTDIEDRVLEDTALTLSDAQANAWTTVFTAVIPAVFLVAGTVVFFRRKYL